LLYTLNKHRFKDERHISLRLWSVLITNRGTSWTEVLIRSFAINQIHTYMVRPSALTQAILKSELQSSLCEAIAMQLIVLFEAPSATKKRD